ncbi:MAG: undecaprenyldiphospho-muramoylpentapeptide beta-N-acetylglucosaminyltransferase [Desulfovibrio sp.]
MKLVITTGGTGGHVYPAIAVAQELLSRDANSEVLFIGGSGPERKMAEKANIRFEEVPTCAFKKSTFDELTNTAKVNFAGIRTARRILKEFKPDVVMGFGGYASFPAVAAARWLKIPTAIHEQNSIPGKANRVLGKFVKKVFTSFEATKMIFPKGKSIHTGNPVRAEIFEAAKTPPSGKRLLVLGGSQGAHAINMAMLEATPRVLGKGYTILHQTGDADFEVVTESYAGRPGVKAVSFIDDMATAYANADVVICRSGASTLFEVAAAARPAIFVPYPYATDNHQHMNTKQLVDNNGAARIIQADFNGVTLLNTLDTIAARPGMLTAISEAAAAFACPDAAKDIVDELKELTEI